MTAAALSILFSLLQWLIPSPLSHESCYNRRMAKKSINALLLVLAGFGVLFIVFLIGCWTSPPQNEGVRSQSIPTSTTPPSDATTADDSSDGGKQPHLSLQQAQSIFINESTTEIRKTFGTPDESYTKDNGVQAWIYYLTNGGKIVIAIYPGPAPTVFLVNRTIILDKDSNLVREQSLSDFTH